VHVSMMAPWRVEKVTDIVKLGDEVMVKIMEMEGGKNSLSMKDAPGNKLPERPAPRPGGDRPRSSRPPQRGGRGDDRGNRRPPARPASRPPQQPTKEA
jgi:polyribonucleotide nucleotidyltransferase